jgi:hypothetical protein
MTRDPAAIVRDALQASPEPYRTVVILRHYENLKFREIADLLDDRSRRGAVRWNARPEPIIVQSTLRTSAATAEIVEDLKVMARILDKALPESARDQDASDRTATFSAMGIRIPNPNLESSMNNLYLEGFGVVFFLRVDIPMLASDDPQTVSVDTDQKLLLGRRLAGSFTEGSRATVLIY